MKEKKKKQKSKEIQEKIKENLESKEENPVEIIEESEKQEKTEEKNETEEYEFYRPTISSETYVDTVDSLVKEVQLFHEEGEIGPSKKSKLGLIIGILLFVIVSIIIILLLVNNNNDDKENNIKQDETLYNYEYKELEDRIEFYDGDELIDTYICMSNKCSVYSFGMYSYFSVNPATVAIVDDENVFLYDYENKKTISAFYNTMQNLYKNNQTVAFIVSNSDNLFGIIDTTGKVIVPLEYDAIAYSIGGGEVTDYSYEHNLITVSKDGLWGILSLEDMDVVLDIKYEDIYYNEYNRIVVKEDDLWYLIDLSGEKIFEEGYDILIPTKSYVFVSVDGIFNIINYKGNNIINKEIPTYIKSFRERSITVVPIFKIEIDGTVININIMKNDTDFIEYKFNTVNGELTEVIK